ncbi:hypothetical protein ACFFK0_06510 [Paenibacillus chartarius]|uniref:Phage protein n=1 Tax=Paenibacillus chartarius TaxID=747481 RepID=A0ABV6DHL9_9BACL
MTKQLQYKNITFSLSQAEEIGNHDMSFGIYINGELVGSTIYGIPEWEKIFSSEEEKDAFMYAADIEAHKEEARMKFEHEFGLAVEQADQLELSNDEIAEIMEERWSIPHQVMSAILPTSSESVKSFV